MDGTTVMKRILNTCQIALICLSIFIFSTFTAKAGIITFQNVIDQRLDVDHRLTGSFDINMLLSSYSDLVITGGNVSFFFVDDDDPLSTTVSTGNYQLKKVDTRNSNYDWQLYYERNINYYFFDNEYEYYYSSVLGLVRYDGNVHINDYEKATSYDYSLYNFNSRQDDKHFYSNTITNYIGGYGDYTLSTDLSQASIVNIDGTGLVPYTVGVYGSDSIFKSALLSLEFTGRLITVPEPSSIYIFITLFIGVLLNCSLRHNISYISNKPIQQI
mgnify:CR=1 FL=1